jgi:sulfate adenylyltransferase subunit 2
MCILDSLESESIYIFREAVANGAKPVMLYSIGKDSSVMLHLAKKAFAPMAIPFPLLHIDTRFKFREMYEFRDRAVKNYQVELIRFINPEAIEKNINPFEHGSQVHTDITKTLGLRMALKKFEFDMVFGGARRDEEKSRAKERIFSFRNSQQAWDPKQQRPELWRIFNLKISRGESFRVFPLSNWTEADIWRYIAREKIEVVPLYFAKYRPVVRRDGLLIVRDDDRMVLRPGEMLEMLQVRFRTLGCYPLTGAIESKSASVSEIVTELENTRFSEREGRLIDLDSPSSMEKKKVEGYF